MKTIAQVIGANARKIRVDNGLPMTAIANAARNYGAQWSTSRITRMEHGENAFTIEALLTLSLVLTDLTDRIVKPADLLWADEDVELSEMVTLDSEELLSVFNGEGLPLPLPSWEERVEAGWKRDMSKAATKGAMPLRLEDVGTAKKMEMDLGLYLRLCDELWGHPLSVEADRRAGFGDSAQKKGHTTRALMKELADAAGKS